MYNTGIAGFLAAASHPNRIIDTRIIVKTSQSSFPLTVNHIVSYKMSYASVAGKYFTPGNFVATPLEVSLNATSLADSYIDFKTLSINSLAVEAGIKATQIAYVPMGVFYIDKDGISTKSTGGHVTIKASDMPPVLSETFTETVLDLPCTVQEALEHMSAIMGLGIHFSEDFPNLSVTVSETFTLSCTYREALRYFAEVLGAYVCMGREGDVWFKKVYAGEADIGCTLDDNYLFDVIQQESAVQPFQHLSIKANEADVGVTVEIEGVSTSKEYAIYNNPLTFGHPEDFLEGLVEPTSFTAFHPAKLEFHGRPDIDPGDVLKYTYKGVIYTLPICMHTFEYNGGFKSTVESIGTDSLAVSSTSTSHSQAQTDLTALRQNINALVRDLTQTQSEITDINGSIVKVSSILQTVEQLETQISSLDGDLKQLSVLTQTANQLRLDIQTVTQALADTNSVVNKNQASLLTYFDFQADGLTIGLNSSNIKLKLINDRIQFLRDGVEVAYFTEGQLYVTDAHFIKSLILGNFELSPRANGNLSLRRR